MMFKKLGSVIAVFALAIVLLLASCGGAEEKPDIDLTTAIDIASTSSVGLTVKSYTASEQVKLDKDSPEFGAVFGYIEKAVQTRAQPRFSDFGGRTTEIAIPYVLNYTLVFKTSSGTDIEFDYGYDTIWFTSKDMIYGASVNMTLGDELERIISE